MINRLRKQFILVTMISSISVLTIIIGALNIFNYISIINKNDNILNILSDNEGRFPDEFLIPGEDPYMDFPFNRFTPSVSTGFVRRAQKWMKVPRFIYRDPAVETCIKKIPSFRSGKTASSCRTVAPM